MKLEQKQFRDASSVLGVAYLVAFRLFRVIGKSRAFGAVITYERWLLA